MLTDADRVWNRACELDLEHTRVVRHGDRALRTMITAHGLVMRSGVAHALTTLLPDERVATANAYLFFGLSGVAELFGEEPLDEARRGDPYVDAREEVLNRRYWELVPDDATLLLAFREHFGRHPEQYAPVYD